NRTRPRDGRDGGRRPPAPRRNPESRRRNRRAGRVRFLHRGFDGAPLDWVRGRPRQRARAPLVRPARSGARRFEPRLRRLVRTGRSVARAVRLLVLLPAIHVGITGRGTVRNVGRDVPTVAPYGSWESPLTTELIAREGAVSFGWLDASAEGIYWVEGRPQENGRSVLVFSPWAGEPIDVVPTE